MSTSRAHNSKQEPLPFDSDSFCILLDNCCTTSITNSIHDFVGLPEKVQETIKGVGGKMLVTHKGKIKWTWDDNQGRPHTFYLPNSLYAPTAKDRLLSLAQWSQSATDNTGTNKGTWSATYDDKIELHWKNNAYHRSVPYEKSNNIAMLRTTAGASAFVAAMKEQDNDEQPVCFNINVVSDNEYDENDDDESVKSQDDTIPITNTQSIKPRHPYEPQNSNIEVAYQPNVIEFHDDTVEFEPLSKRSSEHEMTPSAELLRLHHRFAHLPFSQIQQMAINGHFSRRLATCKIPLCSACIFGKATRRPWRTKPTKEKEPPTKIITAPGQCISIDQLELPLPG